MIEGIPTLHTTPIHETQLSPVSHDVGSESLLAEAKAHPGDSYHVDNANNKATRVLSHKELWNGATNATGEKTTKLQALYGSTAGMTRVIADQMKTRPALALGLLAAAATTGGLINTHEAAATQKKADAQAVLRQQGY